MFEQLTKSIKPRVQPYIQRIPGEDVFIGTIIFYVLFSLAFFMADHSNIDVLENTIMFFNSWIVFVSIMLYLITANVFCVVVTAASFLASSLAEIILGTLYYPSRMYLITTYAHHIFYSFVIIYGIYFEFKIFSVAIISSYIELSAILKSIKNIWRIKNKTFDIVNAAVFFITRIVLWTPLVATVYILSETSTELILTGAVSLFIFAHMFWSYTQIKNIVRKYFSNEKNVVTPIGKII
jgi:hypothetical protein